MNKPSSVERSKRETKPTERMIIYKIQLVNKEKGRSQRVKMKEEMNNLIKLFKNL